MAGFLAFVDDPKSTVVEYIGATQRIAVLVIYIFFLFSDHQNPCLVRLAIANEECMYVIICTTSKREQTERDIRTKRLTCCFFPLHILSTFSQEVGETGAYSVHMIRTFIYVHMYIRTYIRTYCCLLLLSREKLG